MLTELGQFQHFNYASIVLAMRRVEVVLDAVVAAARQLFGDLGPLVPHRLVQLEYPFFFVAADGVLLNVRVQVVVPSASKTRRHVCESNDQRDRTNYHLPLSALLARAPADPVFVAQTLRDERPPLRPKLSHQVHNCVVFLRA